MKSYRKSALLTSFARFHPGSSPTLHANEMCHSQDTLLAAESTAYARQVRSRPLLVSLAGNQECPPPPSPNSSYQTHQEICGHEKTATNFPRGKRLCANSLRLSFLSQFYTFLPTVGDQCFLHDPDLGFQAKKRSSRGLCFTSFHS